MISDISRIQFSFDFATFLTVIGASIVFLREMTGRRRRDAVDRFSERARSVALERVNNAIERLAQLDFQIEISHRDAWQGWSRMISTKPYMLKLEEEELDLYSEPFASFQEHKYIALRSMSDRQLERLSNIITILDPVVLSFRDFSNAVKIQSHAIAPFLKSAIAGIDSSQNSLDNLFKDLGREMEEQYFGLKDAVCFMENVDLALRRSHAALAVASTGTSEDWLTLRTHLKQVLTESDFRIAAYCLPEALEMPLDQGASADDLSEHEREVLNKFSKFLAKEPEAYIRACLPAILKASRSYNEISSRLLLILSCTTERLVSETGASAAERYQEQEMRLPRRVDASDESTS